MDYHFREATADDAAYLASRLREADKAEVRAVMGKSPFAALISGIIASEYPVVGIGSDGNPVFIFGVCPTEEPLAGQVWMLSSDDIIKYARPFIRECREWIEILHTRHPLLFNVVDERNTLHIKWLQWCGFTFIKRHATYGHEGRPFLEFVRIKT